MNRVELQDAAKVLYDGGWRSTDSDEDFIQDYYDPETETKEEFLDWLQDLKTELKELEEENAASET